MNLIAENEYTNIRELASSVGLHSKVKDSRDGHEIFELSTGANGQGQVWLFDSAERTLAFLDGYEAGRIAGR